MDVNNEYDRTIYKPTSKGFPYIHSLDYSYNAADEKKWSFDVVVAKKIFDRVQEILIDKQTDMAVVTFTLKFEPVEPFYSLVCVGPECLYFGDRIKITESKKIVLKKWDKGWRVLLGGQ